jgi:prepilin-type N-terminal cleavage/methylation domain-containing protein
MRTHVWGRRLRGERGFTLIELMIVILVILVLAAILLPQFGLARERAKKALCVSNQRDLESAIAMWTADNPSPNLAQGEMSATSSPTGPQLAGTPLYANPAAYTEPDDTGATASSGADYFLSAGGTTPSQVAPSYGHVICRYAFGPGANWDPWGGVGPVIEQGTGGSNLNHARGTSASP